MKKLILLGLLVVGLLVITGCTQEQLTQEEKEILGEDGAPVGQATYDKARLNECRQDQECWSTLLSCYRAECGNAADRGACINNCLDRAQSQEEEQQEQQAQAAGNVCEEGSECGFITEEQLEQKLTEFAEEIDDKSVSGAVFGGCPAGSTSSICIDSQKAYCMGSLEHGSQIIDCGATRCSGRFPSGGCWGGDTQGTGEFQKEKPDSTSFGGCPAGSIASVCVDDTEMLCIGSEPYGDQLISCGAGGCSGDFPQASCS